MKICNGLGLLLAAALLAAASASIAMAQSAASSDPATKPPIQSQSLAYRQGAFYFGDDCGGNAVMGERMTGKATPGLILGGAAGERIGAEMNCDDRRQAMSVYRDGLEGPLGQTHNWRNSNGGGNGSMTPLRQFVRDGFSCRDFQEKVFVGTRLVSRSATACRQSDGNWHTL